MLQSTQQTSVCSKGVASPPHWWASQQFCSSTHQLDVLQFSSNTIYLGTASDPTGEGSFHKAAHLQMPIASPKWFLPALVTNLLQLRIPETFSLGLINLVKQPTEFNFLIYYKGCCKGHRWNDTKDKVWKKGHGAPGDPACVQLRGSSLNPALLGLGRDFITYLMLIDGEPQEGLQVSALLLAVCSRTWVLLWPAL